MSSLDAALPFYEALGLAVSHRETVAAEKVHVAMLPAGESRIELLEPSAPDSPIAKFLEKRGPGLHHVALKVPDLRAAVERLRGRGRACSTSRAPAPAAIYTYLCTPPPPEAYCWNSFRRVEFESGNRNHRRQRALLHARLRSAGRSRSSRRPFGAPSDNYVLGTLAGRQVAFLARHGRGHRISPSELNFRANIYGMKSLGVERIISLSAVGSLKEEHRPLDFVIPDQFFDRTRGRVSTFFGEGLVAHISFADPVCPQLAGRGGRGLRGRRRHTPRRAARTSAWKARRSPPRPSRTSTGAGAWT